MAYRRKNTFEPNSFYHIYNRGNRKELIFRDSKDYLRFLSSMERFSWSYSIYLYYYCLMPNHFHMIINSGSNPTEITSYMHRFMTSYCVYFNIKYHLVGRLFQGEYRSTTIRTEESLKKVREYLDQNPVRAGLVARPQDYRWLGHATGQAEKTPRASSTKNP